MNLELRHLKLVAAIADTGNMTRAAGRLHLTQSALSHQLRDAEEQLGTRLFERKQGSMALTPAGERLLRSARAVIEELSRVEKDIQNEIAGANNEKSGRIRLSTECYTVYHWLPPRLKLFQQEHPAVEFELVVEATDNPYEALLNGALDLAIVCNPLRNRRIQFTPLFEDEMVAIVAPDHRLADRKFLEPHDFADETLFLFPPKSDSSLLKEILTPAGVTPRRIQQVNLTEAIIEMVVAGLGVAAMAKWAVAPQLASGTVVGLPLSGKGLHRSWAVAQLRGKQTPRYLQAFVELLTRLPMSGCVSDFMEIERRSRREGARRQRSGKMRGAGRGAAVHA
jgi:LysR family transcriptional regulator, regulator for metE and metH